MFGQLFSSSYFALGHEARKEDLGAYGRRVDLWKVLDEKEKSFQRSDSQFGAPEELESAGGGDCACSIRGPELWHATSCYLPLYVVGREGGVNTTRQTLAETGRH